MSAERVGNSMELSHIANLLLKHLDMEKDQLLGGIEDGLSDFDSCLDTLKVFYFKLDIYEFLL